MRNKYSESGQALIIIALAAVVLFGFAALSIDGSRLFSDRRHAQNAADTSAMAAALAKTRGKDYNTAAQERATSNGYDNNGASNIVVISATSTPKGKCPDKGLDIKVEITSYVKTTFAQILGWTQLKNVVYATARACDIAGGKPLYSGSSVWATKSGTCNGVSSDSIVVQGSGHVQLFSGGFGSASTDLSCFNLSGGNTELHNESPGGCASLITGALPPQPSNPFDMSHVQDPDNCLTNNQPEYNASFDDPPADLNITCAGNASVSGNTMSPGNYTGSFPPSGVTNLNPGTYCINGDFKLTGGSLTGLGVTIVMNNGTLDWNGQSEPHLTAPTSGPYQGLVIYAPPSNSVAIQATKNNQISIEGSGNATVTGTVLAQNLPCKFAGSSQIQKQTLQFICYTWEMNGTGQAEIQYDASQFYNPLTPPSISLLR